MVYFPFPIFRSYILKIRFYVVEIGLAISLLRVEKYSVWLHPSYVFAQQITHECIMDRIKFLYYSAAVSVAAASAPDLVHNKCCFGLITQFKAERNYFSVFPTYTNCCFQRKLCHKIKIIYKVLCLNFKYATANFISKSVFIQCWI